MNGNNIVSSHSSDRERATKIWEQTNFSASGENYFLYLPNYIPCHVLPLVFQTASCSKLFHVCYTEKAYLFNNFTYKNV